MDPLHLAGVLRWAVEGCQQYLEHGLNSPEEVVAATKEYRAESDVIGRFIKERCVRGEYVEVQARAGEELWSVAIRQDPSQISKGSGYPSAEGLLRTSASRTQRLYEANTPNCRQASVRFCQISRRLLGCS